MELSIFEILRRDIIAASELLGSAVGATSPHQMLMVRMCPLSPPPSHHHRIQMRPLMHLEHRKPANAALDDLLVVIVCVSSSTGDDVGGGGCHGRCKILNQYIRIYRYWYVHMRTVGSVR